MRITKRQLKTLIESMLLESDKWYSKTEDTEYGEAAKQTFKVPGKSIEIYVFPDESGQQPEEFKTPDGPKYYYGKGDKMVEAETQTDQDRTFIYHPENKPNQLMKEAYDDLGYVNKGIVSAAMGTMKKAGKQEHAAEIMDLINAEDVSKDEFNTLYDDEEIREKALTYSENGYQDADFEELISVIKDRVSD